MLALSPSQTLRPPRTWTNLPAREPPARSTAMMSLAINRSRSCKRRGGSSSARAKHAAPPTHGEKVGAGLRQTKRLKKGEARSENEAFGTARPEATEPHEARMVVEAGQPAAKKVERGGRRGRWVTTPRGRTDSASSLPAGQRWKRRLPRASW